MKIAVPVSNGILCMHFGHCDEFAIVDAEPKTRTINGKTSVTPPPHEPGLLPRWLHDQGVELVIAGGMGARAQQIFDQAGVKVIVGASAGEPEQLVKSFMEGSLVTGGNTCDH